MINWVMALKTISEANCTEHWSAKSKRHRKQKKAIQMHFLERPSISLPCTIKMTRVGPKKLDSDNLQTAFKWIRDEIANQIFPGLPPGRADDSDQLNWQYDQQVGKKYFVKVEIF